MSTVEEQEQYRMDLQSLSGMYVPENEEEEAALDGGDFSLNTVRKVLGVFLIITALALMIFIFPWGNEIDGNILAAQLSVFGIGLIVFFIAIATFVAN
jgi:hypothetical protein